MAKPRNDKMVHIRYKGFKEGVRMNLSYLRTKNILLTGHGTVFTVPENDDWRRLLAENPEAFELTTMMTECPHCGRIMKSGQGLLVHMRIKHPEVKSPEGPATRQKKTKKYAAKTPMKTEARKAL